MPDAAAQLAQPAELLPERVFQQAPPLAAAAAQLVFLQPEARPPAEQAERRRVLLVQQQPEVSPRSAELQVLLEAQQAAPAAADAPPLPSAA